MTRRTACVFGKLKTRGRHELCQCGNRAPRIAGVRLRGSGNNQEKLDFSFAFRNSAVSRASTRCRSRSPGARTRTSLTSAYAPWTPRVGHVLPHMHASALTYGTTCIKIHAIRHAFV